MPHASSSGAGSSAAAGPSTPRSSYGFYLGTATGLSSVRLAPPLSDAGDAAAAAAAVQSLPQAVEMVDVPATISRKDTAVQRMAAGHVGKTWVIAAARKNGSIDLLMPLPHEATEAASTSASGQVDQPASDDMSVSQDVDSTSAAPEASAPAPPPRERLQYLACVSEPRMRVGMERWVGLAVSDRGLYSLTSAGAFRFTPLVEADAAISLGDSTTHDLPGPLQTCVFHPPTSPTHFLIGGDDVSPSLWDLSILLSPSAEEETTPEEPSAAAAAADAGLSAKERKRKRQAESRKKARELLPGEIWRAKALPNDALSLPQAPRITSACILRGPTSSSSSDAFVLAAGTRDGLLRLYSTGGDVRKARSETRVVPAGAGAVRLVVAGAHTAEGRQECFVADGSGKLYATDEEGQVTYSYKDITGAVNVLLPLPSPLSSSTGRPVSRPLLVSASLDRLLRLHSTAPGAAQRSDASKERGAVLCSAFAGQQAVAALVWDGAVPELELELDVEAPEEEEEEVWNAMQRVGAEEEEEDEEEERGKKAKRH